MNQMTLFIVGRLNGRHTERGEGWGQGGGVVLLLILPFTTSSSSSSFLFFFPYHALLP